MMNRWCSSLVARTIAASILILHIEAYVVAVKVAIIANTVAVTSSLI